MLINKYTRFPHPILSNVTGDYKSGNYSVSVIIEETRNNGKLKMNFTISLQEPKLNIEVHNGNAVMGIFITCLETFYNKAIIFEKESNILEFPPGLLKGRVTVVPLIWATERIKNYSNVDLHDDYKDLIWEFDKGTILGVGNELLLNVGHEKLAPMESIFSLAVNSEVPLGEIRVQIDSDNITIHSHQETFQTINNLRATKIGQSILLNSIYLPAVMEVLSYLKDGESNFSDKKWYKIFNAKCEHLNIDYSAGNFLEDAQKLLKSPISKIHSIGEGLL